MRDAALIPYESDALTAFRQRPAAVVLLESRDEVIEAVRLCHRHRVPFVARGSGTSLSGGSLPVRDGVVLALNRLDRILEIDPVRRIAVVEPGVINLAVSHAAAVHGLYYAPDPSSQSICTIGGNVAFNSGGAHCLRHGMTSNHVLGLEVVLPDGEVVRMGQHGAAGDAGGEEWRPEPDLTGLFVGSEGRFGVATEITLRLLPLPASTFTVLAAYGTLRAAGDAVTAVVGSGLLPAAMEIMDRLAIDAAEAAVDAGYPADAASVLIVELDGERSDVASDATRLLEVLRGTDPAELRPTEDPEQRARIWKGRKGAFSAVGRLSPDYIVQDGVVPRTRLGEALEEIERLSGVHGLRVANVFHAGDGNLHPLILYDGRVDGELQRAEELAGEILKLCIAMGGSITGEHGVGVEKRDYLPEMFAEHDVDLMQRLVAEVDPAGLANPGKMVLAGSEENVAPPAATSAAPATPVRDVADLQELVRSHDPAQAGRLCFRCGGSKDRLAAFAAAMRVPDQASVSLAALTGIVDYDPAEYTLTARAGTPLHEIVAALEDEGQFLPFDPYLVGAGATLGGTIASGLSGPGSLAWGAIRDYVLEAEIVDGLGHRVRTGARVVKNAAGFDVPKLLVGSAGSLGPIVQATVKVFPRPRQTVTVRIGMPGAEGGLSRLRRAMEQMRHPEALVVRGDQPGSQLLARWSGSEVADAVDRLVAELGPSLPVERLVRGDADDAWAAIREFAWLSAGEVAVGRRDRNGGIGELLGGSDVDAKAVRVCGSAISWRSVAPDQVGVASAEPGENELLRRIRRSLDPAGRIRRHAAGP